MEFEYMGPSAQAAEAIRQLHMVAAREPDRCGEINLRIAAIKAREAAQNVTEHANQAHLVDVELGPFPGGWSQYNAGLLIRADELAKALRELETPR